MGQIIPLTAGAELIEDGVDDFTEIDFSIFASSDFGWNESGEDVPLGIGEVGWIGFACHFGLGGLVKGKSCQVSLFQALHAIPILQIASNNVVENFVYVCIFNAERAEKADRNAEKITSACFRCFRTFRIKNTTSLLHTQK